MPDRKIGGERYQDRVVASFRQHQLREILEWYMKMNPKGEEELDNILAKIDDEKKRVRYEIGLGVLSGISGQDKKLSDVREVLVWQSNGPRQSRYVQFKFLQPSKP